MPRQLIPHGTRWPRPWWHRLDASAFRLTSVTTRQGNSAQARLGGAIWWRWGKFVRGDFFSCFFLRRGGNWKTPKVKEYISRKLSDFVSKKFRLLKFWEGQGSFLMDESSWNITGHRLTRGFQQPRGPGPGALPNEVGAWAAAAGPWPWRSQTSWSVRSKIPNLWHSRETRNFHRISGTVDVSQILRTSWGWLFIHGGWNCPYKVRALVLSTNLVFRRFL